ncbi:MAG: DUF1553 domain-containing protein [Planctomycetales bacterium]|nr:DUF1553 domain-containing protein [Planctomycetales bacterium]
MWQRNLLFISLGVAGLAALGSRLLSNDPIVQPTKFDATRYERPDIRIALQQVDDEFEASWKEKGLSSAGTADDLIIARRLSLGLTGTIPSLEEVRVLQSLPENQRLEWWISRLLEDRRYSDYVAERLARSYVGTDNGPFIVYRRRRFVTWLSDQLLENKPYDQMVRELISDKGIWTNSPSVNFLTVTLDEGNKGKPDAIRLAARTTRAFLGMRIDCLQCHDDNLGTMSLGSENDSRTGLQSDFHHLAAFYGGTKFSLFGVTDGKDDYKYQYLHADKEEIIEPRPPFAEELLPDEGTQREKLAAWVTSDQNRPFARAMVNRMWAMMFGKPLVEPIDSIPLFGEYPPGLEALADDFVKHDYDLQHLIRMIAGTKAFQLSSRADFEVTQAHEDAWAVFPITRLRPEQMAGGIIQAASLTTIDAESHIISQLIRFNEQNQFIKRYGDTGEDEFEDRAGTIAQRLLMMNGELVKERSQPNPFLNATTRISVLAPTDEKAVETSYLTVLSRLPTAEEQSHFAKLLSGTKGDDRSKCLEDLYWVLVNSTEFSWNH